MFRKKAAIVAAVVSDCHFDFFVWEGFFQVVGQTLCGHAYGVDIHTVGADTHDAAQASCSEFEILIEALG